MTEEYVYLDVPRSEMVAFVPDHARHVLDVGCGLGGFGRELRAQRTGIRITGVETDQQAASRAHDRYDQVLVGRFPDVLGSERYDCVVFNDVLEHMIDPWAAVRSAMTLLEPRGVVVASIPNLRYATVLSGLLLHRRFAYTTDGVLDRTHLRFFTQRSMRELFESSGMAVERMEPINLLDLGTVDGALRTSLRLLSVLRPELARDLRAQQYALVARPVTS